MEEKAVKVGVAGIGGIFAFIGGSMTPLIWILVLFEVMDYVSGIVSATKHKRLSSSEALWGFAKKLFYFFMIAVAFSLDFVIHEAGGLIGIAAKWPGVFGILSVCYLISTEAISILENLTEMDITVPFLANTIKAFRDKVEGKGENKDKP